MPYVVDNNESFETLSQAQNMYRFGLRTTFGVTDSSNGPDPAQHPYVYTHEGNLPRFWALLLYALGARSIEPQIVITTFTIGIAGLWLMYTYFSRIANPLFAFITGVTFNTDYLLYLQWQVNTFRIWHTVFLFACLLCGHVAVKQSKLLWIRTFLLYAALVYFEAIFAIFTMVLCGIYVVLVHRSWRSSLFAWSGQLAGAFVSIAIMVLQLIAYYGLSGLRQDFYVTYFSRNYAAADPELSSKLVEFLSNYHVLFWENSVDSRAVLKFPRVAEDLYQYTIGLLTMPFANMGREMRAAVLALILGAAALGIWSLRLYWKGRRGSGMRVVGAYLVAGACAYLLTLLLLPGYVVSTYIYQYSPLPVFVIDALLAGICYGLFTSARAGWLGPRGLVKFSGAAAMSILFAGLSGEWIWAQVSDARQYPPTVLTGLERLRQPPYKGSSFIANNAYRTGAGAYVASNLTGEWAYFDRSIGYKPIEMGLDSVHLQHDRSYIWLADRATNAAYMSPDYFMCFSPPTPDQVVAVAARAWPDCSEIMLVQSALLTLPETSMPYVDPSGRNNWAIVDLRQLEAYLESVRLPRAVQFSNGMNIVGLERPAVQIGPGEVLHLALVWQAAHHIDFDYSAFVRLEDDQGHVIHGPDHEPGMEYKLPLPNWNDGLLVRDDWSISIPVDAMPGDYQLEVGVYNYQTMAVVKSLAGNGAETLGAVTIAQPTR